MKLRELINRLEELSNNGKNDNMDVEVWSESEGDVYDLNRLGLSVKNAYIDRFCSPNDEYEFIQIITE